MTTAEQLDPPWPGDEPEAEHQARRRKLLAELSDDQIRDMVCDALDDWVTDSIRQFFIMHDQPKVPEFIAVASVLNDRLAAAKEQYLEANE